MKSVNPRTAFVQAVCLCWTCGLATTAVEAGLFQITPLDLGSGITMTGTITTDGTTGPLLAANILRWDIRVDSATDRFFNPGNTSPLAFSEVRSDGQRLTVATSPDGSSDGGSLWFYGGRRYMVQVADFTSGSAIGGQAYYVAGSGFDLLPLNQPDGTNYVAAQVHAPGSGVFDLAPLDFGSGVSLLGTITTDGATGLLDTTNLVDWNIVLREQTLLARLTEANSHLYFSDGLSVQGRQLLVENPLGALAMGTAVLPGGHPTIAELANFSDSVGPGGEAGFFSPLEYLPISPLSFDAQYVVATAVPEPSAALLLAIGALAVGAIARRRIQGRGSKE